MTSFSFTSGSEEFITVDLPIFETTYRSLEEFERPIEYNNGVNFPTLIND
jgi:hypothetical protein